jgi:hypothetical protein
MSMPEPDQPGSPGPQDDPESGSPLARRGSFLQTMGAVAWSFLGIRRSRDHERDVRKLNPLHVVLAAFLGVAMFVLFLAALVHFATAAFAPAH